MDLIYQIWLKLQTTILIYIYLQIYEINCLVYIQGLLWIGLSILFIRIGEVRLSGGKLSDVCSCKSNAISTYDPNAVNTDRLPDEDEDVKEERQTVEAMWNDPSEVTFSFLVNLVPHAIVLLKAPIFLTKLRFIMSFSIIIVILSEFPAHISCDRNGETGRFTQAGHSSSQCLILVRASTIIFFLISLI